MTIPLLDEEELLDTAVNVGTDVVPGIPGVVLVCVRPWIGQESVGWMCLVHVAMVEYYGCRRRDVHFSGVGFYVGEGVVDVC